MPGTTSRNPYRVGDEVVVTTFTGPAAGPFAVISEPWRLPLLGVVAAVFALAVLIVGGLRGARSLVALALTLTVVVKLVVPLLLAGFDPILLAVGTAAGITLATLLLTEGPGRVTASAVIGTFGALTLTAGLAALFTAAAEFTALQGNEEIAFLIPLIGERVDLAGHPAGGHGVRGPRRPRRRDGDAGRHGSSSSTSPIRRPGDAASSAAP